MICKKVKDMWNSELSSVHPRIEMLILITVQHNIVYRTLYGFYQNTLIIARYISCSANLLPMHILAPCPNGMMTNGGGLLGGLLRC